MDILEVPNFGKVEVSIVDAANPLVFVKAKDMGMTGLELPEEVNADADKLALLETVRGLAAVMIGLIEDYTRSAWETPGIPKMTFVAEAADYVTAEGVSISKENVDLLSRMMSMQKAHPSYAMTGPCVLQLLRLFREVLLIRCFLKMWIHSLSVSDIPAVFWSVA